ncbi:TPA: SAM-dependent methyltransferase, partial [Candidatus Latescibacteria bacterium]|nr:SAM-dependent methyltransferase [Candidatus Latescibacterota bacterium]
MESDLTAHRGVWKQNDLLRTLYGRWYRKMVDLASPVPGKRLEIGGGIG